MLGGSIAATLCVCIAIAVFSIGQSIAGISREQTAITPVIQQFMKAMEQRDTTTAYRLFSSRAQRQTPLRDVETLAEGDNYILFEGYEDATISDTSVTSSVNTNADVPQGTVANVNGTITYTDGIQGSFRATLEKENNEWKLFFINITVPPSKSNASP